MSTSAKQSFCCAQHHLCFGHYIYLFLHLGRFPSQAAVTKQNITNLSQANLGIARAFIGGKKESSKKGSQARLVQEMFSHSVAPEENVNFFLLWKGGTLGKQKFNGKKKNIWNLNGKKNDAVGVRCTGLV